MSNSQVKTIGAELVLNHHAVLGEAAIWDSRKSLFYWADIEGRKLHLYNPATNASLVHDVKDRIGTVVPSAKGDLIIALQSGIYSINVDDGHCRFLVNPITDDDVRFNDGKCDANGRLWVGTMHLNQVEGAASLYKIEEGGLATRMLEDLTISNGICWSADSKTMYHIDTPTSAVSAFDFDLHAGTIHNRRTVIEIPEELGHPDGMTMDEEGNLWVALYGGGGVGCWDPLTGELLMKIEVDAPNTTSCAFGDDDLSTLYITTANQKMSPEELARYPLSGALFKVKPGVKGVAAEYCVL